MAKKTWIPPRFKNQLHCGIVAGGRGVESSVAAWAGSHYGGPQLSRQNQKPHSKTKNLTAKTKYLTAKPKTSRQKQKPHCKNKIPHDKTKDLTAKPKSERPHGKTKYFTAKTKYLTAKANTHCKTKAILLLPCSI